MKIVNGDSVHFFSVSITNVHGVIRGGNKLHSENIFRIKYFPKTWRPQIYLNC